MSRWLTLGVLGLVGALATGCHARAHVVYAEDRQEAERLPAHTLTAASERYLRALTAFFTSS